MSMRVGFEAAVAYRGQRDGTSGAASWRICAIDVEDIGAIRADLPRGAAMAERTMIGQCRVQQCLGKPGERR
ncbi:hypothetical protein [Pandoraea morbifera]|uniref:hypothetical protein n=1 Tax=Pandoraea morbifera TaxID=2508300 RepID=UPI001583DAB7|nr:hypothetical protein [Pandoraea morbifera]